jgi:hypothetical protein
MTVYDTAAGLSRPSTTNVTGDDKGNGNGAARGEPVSVPMIDGSSPRRYCQP